MATFSNFTIFAKSFSVNYRARKGLVAETPADINDDEIGFLETNELGEHCEPHLFQTTITGSLADEALEKFENNQVATTRALINALQFSGSTDSACFNDLINRIDYNDFYARSTLISSNYDLEVISGGLAGVAMN